MQRHRITYLGHATVLIEAGGRRVLTDPVLRSRVGHLRRQVGPPEPAHLRDLDAVLLSHGHHDHLDLPSLRTLPGEPALIAGPSAAEALRRTALPEPTELAPGGSEELGELEISAVEASHDGRRWPWMSRSPSVGFVVAPPGGAGGIYFAGDTDLFDSMHSLADSVRAALIPISGWGPKTGPGHLDPARAAEATARLDPEVVIPIHWGTYRRIGMNTDPRALRTPLREFEAQLAGLAPSVRVAALEPGESVELAAGPSV